MRANEKRETWEKWRDEEIARARAVLALHHYSLDDKQVHVSGERFLVSGRKLVLTGVRNADNLPVIIKFSSDLSGIAEIRDERHRREMLRDIHFAYHTMRFPEEILWHEGPTSLTLITRFIPQKNIFIELPIAEQFFFALSALESQEGTHIATREHEKMLTSMGGAMRADEYLNTFDEWYSNIEKLAPTRHDLHALLKVAREYLHRERTVIERYSGFLTHTDFVPHNLRITDRQIVMLDHTSLIIGNKYESWARFINFMSLFNPELEAMLLQYVRENRGPDEYRCLRLMRIYKMVFLLNHHICAHQKSEGDLHLLTGERVILWGRILESVLADRQVAPEILASYKSRAIALRSPAEVERQKEISGWK